VVDVGFVGIHHQLCPSGITEVFFKLSAESERLFGGQTSNYHGWLCKLMHINHFMKNDVLFYLYTLSLLNSYSIQVT
jgi:hypothetical protein